MCNLLNFIDNINNVLKLTHFVKATYEAQFPRLSGWGCALFGHCSEPSLFASCFSDDGQIIWNCKRALQSNASFDKSCLSRDVLTQKKSINLERSFHPHLSFIRLLYVVVVLHVNFIMLLMFISWMSPVTEQKGIFPY